MNEVGTKTKVRAAKYRQALEKLLSSPVAGKKGTGKTCGKGSKSATKEILVLFKEKCDLLGVQFREDRAKDIAGLLAALRACLNQLDV